MKNLILSVYVLSLLTCTTAHKEPITAQLFGKEIISSELPEFATSLNADRTEVFFNRTLPDRSEMWIMQSTLQNGVWTEAQKLPFSTGEYLDVDPFLTPDGNRLYFSSTRPLVEGDPEQEELDTWYVERQGNSWSSPINPGAPLNSDSTEIFVSMTNSGNAYFVSESDGNRGIKVSRMDNGSYQPMEPVILKLRGEAIYASNPAIAYDESFIIVAVRDPQGNNTPDLFISWNTNGIWSELENLGPLVNDPEYADFAPGISKDNRYLYFTSERPGIVQAVEEGMRPPSDLYIVDLAQILSNAKEQGF